MISIEQIQETVKTLFSSNPSKNLFTTDYIRRYVEQFLLLSEPIPMSDMILALRGVEHCVARPKMRQAKDKTPEILWVFVAPPTEKKTSKSTKKGKGRDPKATSVFKSMKMHRAS